MMFRLGFRAVLCKRLSCGLSVCSGFDVGRVVVARLAKGEKINLFSRKSVKQYILLWPSQCCVPREKNVVVVNNGAKLSEA